MDELISETSAINGIFSESNYSSVSSQDVSNLDGSFGFGYRSAGTAMPSHATGALSPTQGRSLREYDEKFQALRKENFNLKLRVYFLEEKSPTSLESKQNIDFKIEIEVLRKELQEKQELLLQAAHAMSMLEDSSKKLSEIHAAEMSEVNKRNDELQNENKSMQKRISLNETSEYQEESFRNLSKNNSHYDDLHTIISRNEEEIEKLKNDLRSLDDSLAQRDTHIEELENQLTDIQNRPSIAEEGINLESSVPNNNEVNDLKKEVLFQKQRYADKLCQIQDLEEKFAEKSSAHDKGLQTLQLLLIKTKEMHVEIERLKSRHNSSNTSTNDDLRLELEHAKGVAEQEKRWRTECANVCSVLTLRLKELAGFLDSLLKHKDVLSVLAQDSHRVMRKAVDNSLDLSRSLSMTSQGRYSLNEKSLMQMSSITDVLNDSYFAGRDLRNETALNETSVVDQLRAEVHSLRFKLEEVKSEKQACPEEIVKQERIFRNVSSPVEVNSDSEELWSEPDRQVSHERIGLEASKVNSHVRSPANNKFQISLSSSASDELDFQLTRKNSSLRLQDKVNDLEAQVAHKSKELAEVMTSLLSNISEVESLKNDVLRLTKDLDESEELRSVTDMALGELRQRLIQAQAETKDQLMASERLLEEQKTVNTGLVEEVDKMRVEIRALVEAHEREMGEVIARESIKLKSIEDNMTEQHRKDIDERMHLYNAKIEREMVPRIVYEDQINHSEELEKRLHEVESLLEMVRNREHELHAEISAKEATLRDTQRNVDELSLQQSRVVLERTKVMNERDHFESLYQELKEKNDELASGCSELHTKLAKLSHDNAQLHNKLVVNETQFQLTRSASQGNARYALTAFSGPASGGDQSGYTSDEARNRLENSSPDLGIESDGTGRSSGTDGRTVQSPTGKLSRSISNILLGADEEDDEFDENIGTAQKAPSKSCSGLLQHDCDKIDHENSELRRKLDRTRRAFERTWAQLRISNQRKEQIEKDIRQEIYKTHSVLKNARTNIENASPEERLSFKKATP